MASCKSLVSQQDTSLHPSRPSSIPPINIDWNIIPVENQIMYAINEHDYKMLNKLLIEASEYNEKTNALLCYYRKDLEEPICKY